MWQVERANLTLSCGGNPVVKLVSRPISPAEGVGGAMRYAAQKSALT